MHCKVLVLALTTLFAALSPGLSAQTGLGTDIENAPWLEGVDIPLEPPDVSPVVPLDISGGNGDVVPATFTEDIPVILTANSGIFAEKPPASYKGTELPDAEWTGQASVRWFFEDVGKNQSTLASATGQLPANQMAVTPLDPTGFGAVTVTVARPMKYRTGPDSFKGAFVNSSHSLNVAVTDLTPPTCGLEVTADGNAAVVYPLENPPHKYPLPKIADVVCQGKLFGTGGNEENLLVEGLELGGLMIIPADRAALHVAKNAVLGMKPLLRDNQQVNEKSVRFGLCEGAVIPPTLVGSANPTELKLAEFKLPEKPYLFIEADDISGNTQVLFIPLMIK